jgi:peptidoglycan hydrolase-like protein with peptidoglycan-binding domain
MEISKKAKIALYSVPIFVGIYLIFNQLAKSKVAKVAPIEPIPPQPKTPSKPTQNIGKDNFPLHNGSRDAGSPYAPAGRVLALQRMINQKGYLENGKTLRLKEDGIYGPKTTAAVEYWLQKNIVHYSDWDTIFRNIAPYIAAPAKNLNEFPDYNPKF